MDIVVNFEKERYIVELKIWRGDTARDREYEQLLGYMDSMKAVEGYLLTFDFRKQKTEEYGLEWVDVGGKRIFDIVV